MSRYHPNMNCTQCFEAVPRKYNCYDAVNRGHFYGGWCIRCIMTRLRTAYHKRCIGIMLDQSKGNMALYHLHIRNSRWTT